MYVCNQHFKEYHCLKTTVYYIGKFEHQIIICNPEDVDVRMKVRVVTWQDV